MQKLNIIQNNAIPKFRQVANAIKLEIERDYLKKKRTTALYHPIQQKIRLIKRYY